MRGVPANRETPGPKLAPLALTDWRRGRLKIVIDEAGLRRMTSEERQELARLLARIELPHPHLDPRLVRRRRVGLISMMAVCVFLAGWIAFLALTLHKHFVVRHWPVVWVGLDLVELVAFASMAWAAWKERQIVIVLMLVTGTLLICDAWFDVASAYGSRGFIVSLLSATCVEVPLALMLFAGARRLTRLTVHGLMRLQGITGDMPPLHRIPLFADGLEEAVPPRFRRPVTAEDRVSSQ